MAKGKDKGDGEDKGKGPLDPSKISIPDGLPSDFTGMEPFPSSMAQPQVIPKKPKDTGLESLVAFVHENAGSVIKKNSLKIGISTTYPIDNCVLVGTYGAVSFTYAIGVAWSEGEVHYSLQMQSGDHRNQMRFEVHRSFESNKIYINECYVNKDMRTRPEIKAKFQEWRLEGVSEEDIEAAINSKIESGDLDGLPMDDPDFVFYCGVYTHFLEVERNLRVRLAPVFSAVDMYLVHVKREKARGPSQTLNKLKLPPPPEK